MTQQPLVEFISKLTALYCKASRKIFSQEELEMPVIQRGNRCFNDDKGILMLHDCLSNGHI